ncbi:MAG TPA: hypothetical protein VG497_01395 [Kribbella sp.]|nr:hypothetical protein [Kribbella sp.]
MTEAWPGRPTIYLSTAEGAKPKGGVYHADALRAAADAAEVNLVSLVRDRSLVPADQQYLATTPAEVRQRPGDVLVVTSAQEFPLECADALPGLPLVASSLTALAPEKTAWADALDLQHRAVAVTAESELAWPAFAQAVGLPENHPHRLVGSPRIDSLPRWEPTESDRTVAVPTLVRGETPEAEYPLQAALELREAGYRPVICPHPREDLTPYVDAGLQITDQKTVQFAAQCRYVVGPLGSVNGDLAALSREDDGRTVGPAVVAMTGEQFSWPPAYLLNGCTQVRPGRGESVVDALRSARPASTQVAEQIVGPVGGAADRLVAAWAEAGRQQGASSPDPGIGKFLQTGPVQPSAAAPAARVDRAGTTAAQRGAKLGD